MTQSALLLMSRPAPATVLQPLSNAAIRTGNSNLDTGFSIESWRTAYEPEGFVVAAYAPLTKLSRKTYF